MDGFMTAPILRALVVLIKAPSILDCDDSLQACTGPLLMMVNKYEAYILKAKKKIGGKSKTGL